MSETTPEQRAIRRKQNAESYKRKKTGRLKKRAIGTSSRQAASVLTASKAPPETLVQQVFRVPLDLVQRLDNASFAMQQPPNVQPLDWDKTAMATAALDQYLTSIEKIYNNSDKFLAAPERQKRGPKPKSSS